MKLVTFGVHGESGPITRAGVATDDHIVDVHLAIEQWRGATGREQADYAERGLRAGDLMGLIRGGEQAIDDAREAVAYALQQGSANTAADPIFHSPAAVQLLAPLPRPNSLRDYMVIREHLENALAQRGGQLPEEWFNIPAHYKGNVDEIYGPDDTVPWPAYTDKLDYELEICAVIGTPGRRVRAADAARHIVGFTLYNDWSARDIQFREMSIGIGPGISKDFGSSIGPCILTAEEFNRDGRVEARIDGEVWSSGSIGTMHFSYEEIIEWTTQEETLQPGDLLGSGTVGRGCGLELNRWLTEGCVVELEAEGIGTLRNTVGHKGVGPQRAFDLEAVPAPAN